MKNMPREMNLLVLFTKFRWLVSVLQPAYKPWATQEPILSSAGAIKHFPVILEDSKETAHTVNKFDSRDKIDTVSSWEPEVCANDMSKIV